MENTLSQAVNLVNGVLCSWILACMWAHLGIELFGVWRDGWQLCCWNSVADALQAWAPH